MPIALPLSQRTIADTLIPCIFRRESIGSGDVPARIIRKGRSRPGTHKTKETREHSPDVHTCISYRYTSMHVLNFLFKIAVPNGNPIRCQANENLCSVCICYFLALHVSSFTKGWGMGGRYLSGFATL